MKGKQLLNSANLNGHSLKFHLETQKVEPDHVT